ncbi:hypothetical protein EZV73_02240 [Acidaminobacter sp. JC074]|uniref:sensor histidine kinase n=1 Tax=Acidaminobacter sp. JC074 TaxID=2530199 RepID=UPI001F102014|nr:histidine kinase [Acidaminobacter sp. JC074]MCH4886365.1 hypothetical protein [Acidaminobacter sp. JC074]
MAKKRTKQKKIQQKITFNFTLIMFLTLLIILIVINNMTTTALLKQLSINARKDLEIQSERIDSKISDLYSIRYNIISDPTLQTLMANTITTKEKNQIDSILSEYVKNYPMVNGIFIFDVKGHVINPNYRLPPYDQIISNYDDLHDFIGSGQSFKFSKPTLFPLNPEIHITDSKDNISFFMKYINTDTLRQNGYLLISFKKNWLFEDFDISNISSFDALAILDENNHMIAFNKSKTSSATLNKIIENQEKSPYLKIGHHFKYEDSLDEYTNWRIVGLVLHDFILDETNDISLNILIIGFISLIFTFTVNALLSKQITSPIYKVMDSFKVFENNEWPEPIEHTSTDETQKLTDSVNNLFVHIQKLMNENQKEHEENVALELSLLQAQINPHFIHNTMNALECIALENKNHEIASTIQSMNYLFRLSMTPKNNNYTVKKEFECIDHFIKIMSFRYKNKFEFESTLDPDLSGLQLPKFLLQPLVENAIFHGVLASQQQGGIISLAGESYVDRMRFTIIDNGIGFDVSKIENEDDQVVHHRGYGHIGLSNIRTRLQLYYKDDFIFDITSRPNKGTIVYIDIPKKGYENV